MWRVEYSDLAEKDLLRLNKPERERILKFFRERVSNHPTPKSLAETLAGPLRGLWRFRIGDYRAICDIQEGKLVVLVLEVGHRGDVYR
ncbi:type II toxin-antitoxin system RelE/ParE family toxin [Granulicella sp. S156]|jgi:mRNA interferase RelE/StbE|uniref:type II toxin-antitoxin system RelE family toxin n=1 Tax=Granulicella sp. S156 TaxID=1747224 RepID=UPI00131D058B|nr:type II toxin-antitoxin system RelE/ParE family toxin [Granulicella sp. S156]